MCWSRCVMLHKMYSSTSTSNLDNSITWVKVLCYIQSLIIGQTLHIFLFISLLPIVVEVRHHLDKSSVTQTCKQVTAHMVDCACACSRSVFDKSLRAPWNLKKEVKHFIILCGNQSKRRLVYCWQLEISNYKVKLLNVSSLWRNKLRGEKQIQRVHSPAVPRRVFS